MRHSPVKYIIFKWSSCEKKKEKSTYCRNYKEIYKSFRYHFFLQVTIDYDRKYSPTYNFKCNPDCWFSWSTPIVTATKRGDGILHGGVFGVGRWKKPNGRMVGAERNAILALGFDSSGDKTQQGNGGMSHASCIMDVYVSVCCLNMMCYFASKLRRYASCASANVPGRVEENSNSIDQPWKSGRRDCRGGAGQDLSSCTSCISFGQSFTPTRELRSLPYLLHVKQHVLQHHENCSSTSNNFVAPTWALPGSKVDLVGEHFS